MNISVSIVLDKRRIKSNGKYPVKLRIFTPEPRKQKLYSTIFEFTEKEFNSIWETTKPRNEFKESRKKLDALKSKANEVIDSLKKFSFDAFENSYNSKSKIDYTKVAAIFDEIIAEKEKIGSISTAEKYQLSKNCLKNFIEYENGQKKSEIKNIESIHFDNINLKFIKDFKEYCQNIKFLSDATVGIYLRNLRSVYNRAIKNGFASRENYPFLSEKNLFPSSKKVNKSLNEDELKLLIRTKPENEDQSFAKDFWFFSYYSYGMNTKDICELKHSAILIDSFVYVRAKTKNTKKVRTEKEVPITKSLSAIIEKRKNTQSEYLFGILDSSDSPAQKHEKIKRFNRKINTHFRKFAIYAGINQQLSTQLGTYHARHSFATNAIRKNIPHALISEILHDGNLKTTESYISSFPKESLKNLSNEMEFFEDAS